MGETLLALAPITVSVVIFVEAVLRSPIRSKASEIIRYSHLALRVIRAKRISDHWKERVLPTYSGRLLRASLLSGGWLIVIAALAAVGYIAVGTLFFRDFQATLDSATRWPVQIAMLIIGSVYAAVRTKDHRQSGEDSSGYSAADRALHHLLLGSRVVRETTFDLECALTRSEAGDACRGGPPVYVAGLARAGTTVLLRALHASNQFATLTYRAMPMAIAPNLWQRLTGRVRTDIEASERAHGDGLLVDSDSPEAFEEVFWNTYATEIYVHADRLEPMDRVSGELLDRYRRYVANVVHAAGSADPPKRYLAKNNNNLLRIPVLRAAFDETRIIVPFRHPAAHAASLLDQHRRFLERHGIDPFSLRYMDWLGHFEFGAHMKPFAMGNAAELAKRLDPLTLEYWLAYWTSVYSWVLERHANEVLWFDYDAFCAEPASVLARLAERLELEPDALAAFSSQVRAPSTHGAAERRPGLDHAHELHALLVQKAAANC